MARRRNSEVPDPKIGEDGAALTDDRKKQLAGYISEIERHNVEIEQIKFDVKAIYESAKETGFHTKAMRDIVRVRKVEKEKQAAYELIVDVYRHALGMLSDLPLGQAATKTAAQESADRIARKHSKPPTAELERVATSDRPF